MKFIVKRTSVWVDDKPCEEAVRMKVPCWQTRTCSEEEFDRKFSAREGLWRSNGKNHQITEKGYITRQEEDREVWGVNIKTLKELVDFIDKHGSIVIEYENSGDRGSKKIEIYDDYRE